MPYYGNEIETFYQDTKGRIWVIQTPEGGNPFTVEKLPESAEALSEALIDSDLAETADRLES